MLFMLYLMLVTRTLLIRSIALYDAIRSENKDAKDALRQYYEPTIRDRRSQEPL